MNIIKATFGKNISFHIIECSTVYRCKSRANIIRPNNACYFRIIIKSMWSNTGIYLGVYAGLILFLGLMVFLLTRGKNNINRTMNFWVCQKVAWWSSFTPGLLALPLGFLLASNILGQMTFIVLLSIRVMWLSMRQLRPQ